MNDVTKIRVPMDKLPALLRKAYELSQAQGMGFLQNHTDGLPDVAIKGMIDQAQTGLNDFSKAIRLDYVQGRALKLNIMHDAEGYYLEDHGAWYDHGEYAWKELIEVLK